MSPRGGKRKPNNLPVDTRARSALCAAQNAADFAAGRVRPRGMGVMIGISVFVDPKERTAALAVASPQPLPDPDAIEVKAEDVPEKDGDPEAPER